MSRADTPNYFAHVTAAARYRTGRPFIHPGVIRRAQAMIGAGATWSRCLDVGCGTGQSAQAVAELGRPVFAVDAAAEMLREAASDPRISYFCARAEALPFARGAFDVITVGLAYHWFQADFLEEARRVLAGRGWLVVYNSGFAGRMAGRPEFAAWMRESYLKRYPSPPRRQAREIERDGPSHGFTLRGSESFETGVRMHRSQLVSYLLTQTNIIVAVDAGPQRLEPVRDWIDRGVADYFAGDQPEELRFVESVWCLQRGDDASGV